MYEKCLKCEHLGRECFPNLYVMPVEDIRNFARRLKHEKRMSNSDISIISGVPKGTIDNSFSKKSADIYYTTFAPILCALLGANGEESPCPEEIINGKANSEKIERLEQENTELKEQLKASQAQCREDDQYYKTLIGKKNSAIAALSVVLIIALLIIIGAFVIDRLDSGRGFFWMDHIFNAFGSGEEETLGLMKWGI